MAPMSVCCQVKDLFKELQVECNVVELDLIGKILLYLITHLFTESPHLTQGTLVTTSARFILIKGLYFAYIHWQDCLVEMNH